MKVLVVSHSVFSCTSNMGKTVSSYFGAFDPDEIAEFYIHSEVPTSDMVCRNYYRFTDIDALKSVISLRKYGKIYRRKDIETERSFERTDTGIKRKIYQFGKKRTGMIYLGRNLIWKCSRWFTEDLKHWLDEISPDIVFFASGDYAFMYDVASEIAEYRNVPLVISCVDDFYLYNRNEGTLVGRLEHRAYLKTVHRTMKRTAAIFCICENMAEEYGRRFSLPAYVLHTSVPERPEPDREAARQISYIGNLDFRRYEQLAAIGRVLRTIPGEHYLDVYSGETSEKILALLNEENGIRFHGRIPADEVLQVMENSLAVIHTESFDREMMEQTRFSVSTKIAESLMYGPCLFAYGPEGIASMDYLKENQAAYVVTSPEKLEEGLEEFLGSPELRQQILRNARALARKNHSMETNSRMVRRVLEEIIEK